MAAKRRPTTKQLAYLAGRVAGKSPGRAASEAGYISRPSKIVADLDRGAFNRAVHEAAEGEGVTLETIMAKLGDLMDAKEEKSFVTRAGDVVYAKEQALADVQLKATQTAADLLGVSSKARQAVAEEKRPSGDNVNILVLAQRYEHLTDEQLEEAMQLMRVGQFDGSKLAERTGFEGLERANVTDVGKPE